MTPWLLIQLGSGPAISSVQESFGVSRHTPPRQVRPLYEVGLQAVIDLPSVDVLAELVVIPPELVARARLLAPIVPMMAADVVAVPPAVRAEVGAEIPSMDSLITLSLDASRKKKRRLES